jgi:HSP20 family molecular chaperone IbpA
MTFRPFELDPFDLLWRDLFDTQSHFSAITQKVTHPVDIFETEDGIRFEIAAVGLDRDDISITVDSDQLRITYEKPKTLPYVNDQDSAIYRGIKRSGFDLSWKIATKFDLTNLEATLDKGLLVLSIPRAIEQKVKKIEIKPTVLLQVSK